MISINNNDRISVIIWPWIIETLNKMGRKKRLGSFILIIMSLPLLLSECDIKFIDYELMTKSFPSIVALI
jgi:hypothetical protein